MVEIKTETPLFKYRPDIDGLRAIAVLAVVLYHAKPSLLSGGFVGVDVFFVISGFLITSIISGKIKEKSFSITDFYARRLRRIAPAFLFVVIATILLSAFRFPPYTRVEVGQSVMFTILSVGNHYFHKSAEDYFHSPVESMPLLHTWSLSVEEQFYLIFPIAVIILFKIFKKPAFRSLALLVIAAASFTFSIWHLESDSSSCFYLLHYRAWELLMGSIVAISFKAEYKFTKWGSKYSGSFQLIGAALIASAAFLYDRSTAFPGFAAAIPCFGAVLIIVGGYPNSNESKSIFSKIIESKMLVGIGLISYSVYLWHWPLIVFFKDALPTTIFEIIIVPVSVLVGWFSWKYIEQPFRNPNKFKIVPIFCGWLIISGALLYYSRYIRKHDGFLLPPNQKVKEILGYQNVLNPYQKFAFDKSVPPNRPYIYGATNVVPRFALWGDSHANAIAAVMGDVARTNGKSFKFYGRGGTKPALGVYNEKFGKPNPKEVNYTPIAFENLLGDTNITTVILCARWITSLKGENLNSKEGPMIWTPFKDRSPTKMRNFLLEHLQDTIKRLNDAKKKVILMYPIPELGINGPQLVASIFIDPNAKVAIPSPGDFFARQAPIFEIFKQLPRSNQLIRIQTYNYFIRDEEIVYSDGNIPLYQDDHHLNLIGASRLIPVFAKIFDGTIQDEAPVEIKGNQTNQPQSD